MGTGMVGRMGRMGRKGKRKDDDGVNMSTCALVWLESQTLSS